MGRRNSTNDTAGAKQEEEAEQISVWAKAFTPGGTWNKETFEEFPVVVHWIRQVLAIILGVVWGIVPLTGLTGFISFGAANFMLVHLYATNYLNVDLEDFGQSEVMKEGIQPAFGIFMLFWIITYTAVHQNGIEEWQ